MCDLRQKLVWNFGLETTSKEPVPPLGELIVEPPVALNELLMVTVPPTMVEPLMVPPFERSNEPALTLLTVPALLLRVKSMVVVPVPADLSSVPALLNTADAG